jgi:Peptidase family M28
MLRKPGTLLALLTILVLVLAVHLDYTPAPVNDHPADTSFSVGKAYEHLRQIAGRPHSIGTAEKELVRRYILAQCVALGLDTITQHAVSAVYGHTGVQAGEVTNIIGVYKGLDSVAVPGSAVLVMAHYDSQPNAVGAGDDGVGCAAMLETARLLRAGPRLRNNVIFLFTDGEEPGLLGSTAFVRFDSLFSRVGVVLNFDGRGNAGKTFTISNGSSSWMVDAYVRSCPHTSASSLFHELFRVIPNSTDLLPFSRKAIPGLDFAYVDGFVNYHAMTDRPEDMDRNTFQETGDNMLAEVKCFGNIDIRAQKGGERTFFNVLGGWMVTYPVSWNMVFLVLVHLVFVGWVVFSIVKRRFDWKALFVGFGAFLVVLLLEYFVLGLALGGVRAAYPLYQGYYSNAYNSGYFYLAAIALAVALFTFVFQFLLRRFDLRGLLMGVAIVEVIVLDVLYGVIPTAIYFLCFPLLFVLLGCLFRQTVVRFVSLLPALLLLAPLIYGLFIAFDVEPEAAALGVLTGLLLGLLMPLIALVVRESRWLLPGAAFLLCLLSTGFGVLHGRFSAGQPYKTSLGYTVNTDDSTAFWVLRNTPVDRWNRQFLPHPVSGQSIYNYAGLRGGVASVLMNKAEFVNFSAPDLTVVRDTVVEGRRELTLHCVLFDSAAGAHFDLDSTSAALEILVNGVGVAGAPGGHPRYRWLDAAGLWPEGFDVQFVLDAGKPFACQALSRIMGLPAVQGFQGYPLNMIPGPGAFANTTVASRYYVFKPR